MSGCARSKIFFFCMAFWRIQSNNICSYVCHRTYSLRLTYTVNPQK